MGVNPSNSTILKQLVSFGRGSVGAITIASNKYGQYQKRRLHAQSVTTGSQATWRAALADIGRLWGTLSARQRAAWNLMASGTGKVYANRPAAGLSGSALMAGMNAVRVAAGFGNVYDPPVIGGRPGAPMIESAEMSGLNELTIVIHVEQAPLVPDTGDVCLIQLSRPGGLAAENSPRAWQLCGFVDSYFSGMPIVVLIAAVPNALGTGAQIQWIQMRRSLPDGRYSIFGRSTPFDVYTSPATIPFYADPWTTIIEVDQTITNYSDGSLIYTVRDLGPGIAGLSFDVSGSSRGIDAITTGGWVGPYSTTLHITGASGVLNLSVTLTAGANPYGVVWIPFPGSYQFLPGNGMIYMTGTVSSFADLQVPSPIGNYRLVDIFMEYDVFLMVDYELTGFITVEGDLGEYVFPYTIPPSFVPTLTGYDPDPVTTVIDVSMSLSIATVGGQVTSVTDLGPGISGLSFAVLPTFWGIAIVTDGSWSGPYSSTLQLTGPSGSIDCPIELTAGANPYAFPQVPWIVQGHGSFQAFTPFGVGSIYDFYVVSGDNPFGGTFIFANRIGVGFDLPVTTESAGVLGIDGDQGYWELPFVLPIQ